MNTISEGLINFLLYAMKLNIFLRGCVSYGKYKTNKFVSVGKAIAEAGSYYELANWIGITATPSLYNKIIQDTSEDILYYLQNTTFLQKKVLRSDMH